MIHSEPESYLLTTFPLEQHLTLFIIKLVTKSDKVKFSFDANCSCDMDYIVYLPRLLRLLWMLMLPDLLVGDYYCKGLWYLKKGDLSELIRHLYTKGFTGWYRKYYLFTAKHRGLISKFKKLIFKANYKSSIAKHYDINSEVYELFLDDEMLYTCAFFDNNDDSLEVAQARKLRVIADRLRIGHQEYNLLDIGSGWGGMDRQVVADYDNVRITGLSLSKNQIKWTIKRNLLKLSSDQQKRINYVQQSIHEHEGSMYDGIVAIGMVEHVGNREYLKFFRKIKSLLKNGGTLVIHSIICPHNNFPSSRWIDKYIFPGGYAPSISELTSAIENAGLIISNIFLYEGFHYKQTIELWRDNFSDNWYRNPDQTAKLFPKKESRDMFFRIWYFYLSSVRNMFLEDVWKYKVAHFVINKPK